MFCSYNLLPGLPLAGANHFLLFWLRLRANFGSGSGQISAPDPAPARTISVDYFDCFEIFIYNIHKTCK